MNTENNYQKHFILAATFIFLILVGIFSYFFIIKKSTKESVTIKQKDDSLILETSDFVYPQGNFAMKLPYGWETANEGVRLFGSSSATTKFALKKSGSQCMVAYVRVNTNFVFDNFKQTAFAAQLSTSYGEQQWGSWYLHKDLLPENFQFLNHDRKPFAGDFRMNFYPLSWNDLDQDYKKVLVLFMKDGSAVSPDCDSDFSNMISSIRREIQKITLDKNSKGRAYFDRLDNDVPTMLFFISDNDKEFTKEAINLGDMFFIRPTVYNNEVWLIDTNGEIKKLDIFSGKFTGVEGIVSEEGKQVNDFYIYKNRLFYLFGNNCLDYRATCSLDLYEYDIPTKQSKRLTTSLTSREIIGYDEKRNTLGMTYRDGDAGCFWITGEEYNFTNQKKESAGDFSDCYSSDEKPQALMQFEQFASLFDNGVSRHNYMILQNGRIITPEKSEPSWGWPIRFVTQ